MGVFAQFAGNSPVAPVPQEIRAEDNPELGTVAPGMMGNQRPPPPGCPPGGQYVMVKWCGPQTQQGAECMKLAGCIMLPAWGVGLICCCIACAMENDPKDEKEVYKLGDQHYTLNGTLDERVGPGPYGGARGR